MKNNGIIIYILTIAILATLTVIFIPKAFLGNVWYIAYSIFFLGLTILTGKMFKKYNQINN